MGVPFGVALEAWLPFPIVGIVGVLLAFLYTNHFQTACHFLSSLICVSSVVLSMMVVILIPVDVFLVSSTKNNGTLVSWADNTTVIEMEQIILYGYCSLYILVLGFIFIIIPFTYFYHSSDDQVSGCCKPKGLIRGLKFTAASIVLLTIVIVVGVIVPLGNLPKHSSTIYRQMNYLKEYDCISNYLENGLVFAINCLGLVGMVCAIIYTSFGMSILPINLIKGKPRDDQQQIHMEISLNELLEKIQSFSNQSSSDQPLGATQRMELDRYSRQLSELQSRSDTMRQQSYSPLKKCRYITRPIQVTAGILLLFLSLFVVAALIISNINRLLSSYGVHAGYMAKQTVIVNPVDWLLLLSHKVFPLDYILLSILLFYFTLSSVAGMQHMGIWFLWMQLHRLRSGRTTTRALVFSSFILAVVTIYSGIFIYTIAPQYVTYGTQTYWLSTSNGEHHEHFCSLLAEPTDCLMTRLMSFQTRLFYRMWFFGVAYFWSSWLFVLIFLVSCVVSVIRSRKTIAQIMMRNMKEMEEIQQPLIEV